ncbi:transmembrane protein, putative [Medicago truncatula]|uniref:Transmembrane protein, putative n=1 Tax=Medicago truncatula TaxID=3880 RepID=G7IR48_MEDTR|nr:transmembrane protein, putative [Medicago truncatula]
MIWASTLKIRKHVNFGDLGFIILFAGVLSFYAINLGAVSLFAYSPFTFLAIFVSDVIYRFE